MAKKFSKNSYFKNRELSWIDFNGRVLEEARDADNPLLERINFLGITQSNVDEFFMVRVASLNKLVSVKINDTDPSGMTPKEQIDAINEKEHDMVEKRYSTLNRSLLPLLEKNDIILLNPTDLNEEQQKIYAAEVKYVNDEMDKMIKSGGFEKNKMLILRLLTRLRQI